MFRNAFWQQGSKAGRGRRARQQRPRSARPGRLVERLEDRLLLTAVEWGGGPAGTGTDWNTAANWVGDQLPTAADDVRIGDAFADRTITHADATTTIRSLASAASIE